jgi:alpha-tubulin suppressor-like RCC1 family protein
MKRILKLLVHASLSAYLLVGGLAPVLADQPVGQFRQPGTAGTTVYLPVVMKDSSYLRATSISLGEYHNCALTETGGVKCWGYNLDGELGDGTKTNRQAPVDVVGLGSGVAGISAGYRHTCALTSLGGVKCWGYNLEGRLGNGTTTSSSKPVKVSGLSSGVSAVSAGGFHTCALMQNGAVKCWGDNSFGQLGVGDATIVSSSTPMDVSGLSSGVSAIRAGANHTCALMSGGGVKCWGDNSSGQLGEGTNINKFAPVDVDGLSSGVSAITAGGSHTCALKKSGGLVCWGRNDYGQLGIGSTTSKEEPVLVIGLAGGVSAVSAGSRHTCVLMQAGGARCWGYNYYGQLGNGTTSIPLDEPVNVSVLTDGLSAIGAGQRHTCTLLQAGGVRCWGANDFGQLGNGSTTPSIKPVTLVGFP